MDGYIFPNSQTTTIEFYWPFMFVHQYLATTYDSKIGKQYDDMIQPSHLITKFIDITQQQFFTAICNSSDKYKIKPHYKKKVFRLDVGNHVKKKY